jgi:predicted methyltransferase
VPPSGDTSPPADSGDSSGEKMVEFFEIGRGDRIADLGGVSGYSLTPVRRALGPTGIVYVRRPTPPPTDPSESGLAANDLGKLVWMKTPDDAPFIADATKLNAVTVLFSYPTVSPASRKKFNAAVLRALAPGGLYIIAGHAPSSDTGPGTARQPSAVSDAAVRADVQAAGFQFVEAAEFVSSSASTVDVAPTRYVLKFRKPK